MVCNAMCSALSMCWWFLMTHTHTNTHTNMYTHNGAFEQKHAHRHVHTHNEKLNCLESISIQPKPKYVQE